MKKIIVIIISTVLIVIFGMFIGFRMFNNTEERYKSEIRDNMDSIPEINRNVLVEVSNVEEIRTTPNTLIIYKTYYAKCKHFVQEYKDIDASFVNFTEEEFEEKNTEWDIDKFSIEEIEMSREINSFCNQHYIIKLENKVIVIYSIDENGMEKEFMQTGISIEYLTEEDILRLTTGIEVYGKENLTSTIEDYE